MMAHSADTSCYKKLESSMNELNQNHKKLVEKMSPKLECSSSFLNIKAQIFSCKICISKQLITNAVKYIANIITTT